MPLSVVVGSIQDNCIDIGMGSILPPCLDDLFSKCILKVILERTFDEVTTQLNELHLVKAIGTRQP